MESNGKFTWRSSYEWFDWIWEDLSEEAKAYVRGTGVLSDKN
jgi:hypothetical protein